MTNAFAVLGLEPRPWLEPDLVKSRYHDLARSQAPLAPLNEARKILESPASRLRHLATLTTRLPGPFQKPMPSWNITEAIGSYCSEVRKWHQRQGTTEVERAMHLAAAATLRSQLVTKQTLLLTERHRLETLTRTLDTSWPNVDPAALLALSEEWTFWSRWDNTLHEATAVLNGA